jgi:hypothetical protein
VDIEETHGDAPRDAERHASAIHMAQRYADLIIAVNKAGYSLDAVTDVGDVVYAFFVDAVNDSGYTEEAGFTHPRTRWDEILKARGL